MQRTLFKTAHRGRFWGDYFQPAQYPRRAQIAQFAEREI
jgi:hypothetical protein